MLAFLFSARRHSIIYSCGRRKTKSSREIVFRDFLLYTALNAIVCKRAHCTNISILNNFPRNSLKTRASFSWKKMSLNTLWIFVDEEFHKKTRWCQEQKLEWIKIEDWMHLLFAYVLHSNQNFSIELIVTKIILAIILQKSSLVWRKKTKCTFIAELCEIVHSDAIYFWLASIYFETNIEINYREAGFGNNTETILHSEPFQNQSRYQ